MTGLEPFFLLRYNHRCADFHQLKQLLHIGVVHTDAAQGYVGADGGWIVSAVDAVAGMVQPHPAGAKGARVSDDFFIDDMPVADRCRSLAFAQRHRIRVAQLTVLIEIEFVCGKLDNNISLRHDNHILCLQYMIAGLKECVAILAALMTDVSFCLADNIWRTVLVGKRQRKFAFLCKAEYNSVQSGSYHLGGYHHDKSIAATFCKKFRGYYQ